MYSLYERAVMDGGQLRTIFQEIRNEATEEGKLPDIRKALTEVRDKYVSGSDRNLGIFIDKLNALRISFNQDASPVLDEYDGIIDDMDKRGHRYTDQEKRIHMMNLVKANNAYSEVLSVHDTMQASGQLGVSYRSLRKLIESRNVAILDKAELRRSQGGLSQISSINKRHDSSAGSHSDQQCQHYNRGRCRYGESGRRSVPGRRDQVCRFKHDRREREKFRAAQRHHQPEAIGHKRSYNQTFGTQAQAPSTKKYNPK